MLHACTKCYESYFLAKIERYWRYSNTTSCVKNAEKRRRRKKRKQWPGPESKGDITAAKLPPMWQRLVQAWVVYLAVSCFVPHPQPKKELFKKGLHEPANHNSRQSCSLWLAQWKPEFGKTAISVEVQQECTYSPLWARHRFQGLFSPPQSCIAAAHTHKEGKNLQN